MSVSMRDLDPAFQGAGQKAGLEIWRIENFNPVAIPSASYGKFFMGDSYIVLKSIASKSGSMRHDIHYWLGKDTSQDEAGVAAIKTVELDAALGGRAVQYREVQGHETEKFLSYFKPCIIPQEGGVASGFKHVEAEEHQTRLFVCKGKRVVRVPFARSSLNHDDIFILDTASKIFQFNGSNSSIQERAKALEVVQYLKDTYHDGKCEVASVEDGRLMADAETGEFWGFFGGFAPLPRKTAISYCFVSVDSIEKGQAEPVEADSFTRELLDTNKCYVLDCGAEVYVWMGKATSLDERKNASKAAEEIIHGADRPKSQIIRVMEGFETATFRSKFTSWPQAANVDVAEDGRGKVAALLKRQGLNVKGLVKAAPAKEEEPQPHIDVTGNLQVWRVNGDEKVLLPASDQFKFYSGECYVFQYAYPGEDTEEYLIGTWFGKQSVEEERASAISQASKMVESLKFQTAQARIWEGTETLQFLSIFQSFIIFKGGLSAGYKKFIEENELTDETYSEDGIALFRIQGTGPENMQAIQVEPVASSLNSSYCYILHNGAAVYTWTGNLTTTEDQEVVERLLDLIKPNMQSKPQKEGSESDQFWELLGGKTEHATQKIAKEPEKDPHLFSCSFLKSFTLMIMNVNFFLQATEIYNFSQDDLMTEDVFILDCHSEVYVWVGQQVDTKTKTKALTIGEQFIENDFLLEKLSRQTPIYIVMEGSEPAFFTRFFTWDSSKSAMVGNSFQRRLTILKGGTPIIDKPKRRVVASYGGRSSGGAEKSQRSRSVSFSPERARARGRSPAFNALAATFENPNARNLSTPPPMVQKIYPKSGSGSPVASKIASKAAAIAALTATFEQPLPARQMIMARTVKANPQGQKAAPAESEAKGGDSMSSRIESLSIKEDMKENEPEDEEGLPIFPYERLIVNAEDPPAEIDVTKRETYLSSSEFKEKLGMGKDAFYKLPKWKQNKLKMAVQLF
ncbi:VLN4 [Linum grandiflorum]